MVCFLTLTDPLNPGYRVNEKQPDFRPRGLAIQEPDSWPVFSIGFLYLSAAPHP